MLTKGIKIFMKCKDRQGNITIEEDGQEKLLKYLYCTKTGRAMLKVLISPCVSKLGGMFLNTPISKLGIKPFVKSNNIKLEDYEKTNFKSYNEFFCRKIKKGKRVPDSNDNVLISPCDSKLTVYPISTDGKYKIKNTEYTIRTLTKSRKIEKYYEGGYIFVFRLTVDDYHRYCYIDDGRKTRNYRIKGVFHTVNPIANDQYPIYKENTREFSLLKSRHFKTLLMMEVGALMVGKIVNYHQAKEVKRGEEKGRFEFGGSTVILCVKKDVVNIDEDILNNSKEGYETIVKMGEKIGSRI